MLQNLRNGRRSDIFIYIFPFPLPIDSLLTPVDSVSEILPDDCEDYSPLEELPSQQTPSDHPIASHDATDEELLELAAMGGIQFVRATEDGRYEVMTNSEARDLMAQNSHDVKILGTADDTIDGAISEHTELDYLPTVAALDVIQPPPMHQQQPAEIIVPDSNGIMVLDPNNDQKALTLGDIEILEDKELGQLLEAKCLEDPYDDGAPGGTYLSQAKIDQILNAKTTNVEAIAGIMGESESIFEQSLQKVMVDEPVLLFHFCYNLERALRHIKSLDGLLKINNSLRIVDNFDTYHFHPGL